jgi:hypothetical protein
VQYGIQAACSACLAIRPCSGSYGAVTKTSSDHHDLRSVISRNIDTIYKHNKN